MFLSRRLPVSGIALVAAALCVVAVAVPSSAGSATLRAHSDSRSATTTTTTTTTLPGTYTSRVVGTFGRAGTVSGHFKPLRSFVRNGKTVVQGNLMATLRRGDGSLVGRVTRHDVTLPVKAPGAHLATASTTSTSLAEAAATCTILHLVLGPLDLNLLGLMVHLDRVVLDITAQSGAGNLLGNLLCAVAHLLDNTSPTLLSILRLSSLLNRIIGLIT
jgi:hypothetical protein